MSRGTNLFSNIPFTRQDPIPHLLSNDLCAVRALPVPEIPQDPTSSAEIRRQQFLGNVRQLLMDATTMPALGEYHPQYLSDLHHMRRATQQLQEAVTYLEDSMDNMIANYTNRQLMPAYFYELCRDFPSQL